MNDETTYSFGGLARRTGLTVKATRYYSDRGIVPSSDRTGPATAGGVPTPSALLISDPFAAGGVVKLLAPCANRLRDGD